MVIVRLFVPDLTYVEPVAMEWLKRQPFAKRTKSVRYQEAVPCTDSSSNQVRSNIARTAPQFAADRKWAQMATVLH